MISPKSQPQKACSCSEIFLGIENIVQRLSPCRRVKPQANGGRKILTLLFYILKDKTLPYMMPQKAHLCQR